MALLNTQHRAPLIVSLIGSCVLASCASPFERFYKPAVTGYGSPATPLLVTPLLVRSRDPL